MNKKEKLRLAWRYLTFQAKGEEIEHERMMGFYWRVIYAVWIAVLIGMMYTAIINNA